MEITKYTLKEYVNRIENIFKNISDALASKDIDTSCLPPENFADEISKLGTSSGDCPECEECEECNCEECEDCTVETMTISTETETVVMDPSGESQTFSVEYYGVSAINEPVVSGNSISVIPNLNINPAVMSISDETTPVVVNSEPTSITYVVVGSTNSTPTENTAFVTFSGVSNSGQTVSKTIGIEQSAYEDPEINVSGIPTTVEYNSQSKEYIIPYSNAEYIYFPTSNVDWMFIDATGDWQDGNCSISFYENEGAARTGIVTFKCKGANGTVIEKSVEITQNADVNARVTFSPNLLELDWDTETSSVTVYYNNCTEVKAPVVNDEWIGNITYIEDSKYEDGRWYHYYEIEGITNNNTNSIKTGSITFKAIDESGSEVSFNYTVKQKVAPAASITVTPTYKYFPASVDIGSNSEFFYVTLKNATSYWLEQYYYVSSTGWAPKDNWIICDWGTEQTDESFLVGVEDNTKRSLRQGTFKVCCKGADGVVVSKDVTIRQAGKYYPPEIYEVRSDTLSSITEENDNLFTTTIDSNGGTYGIDILYLDATGFFCTYNYDWVTSKIVKQGFLDGYYHRKVEFTIESNPYKQARECIIKVKVTEANAKDWISFVITQEGNPNSNIDLEQENIYYGYMPLDIIYDVKEKESLNSIMWDGLYNEGFGIFKDHNEDIENNINICVDLGYLKCGTVSTMDKTSFGKVSELESESVLFIAIPENAQLTAKVVENDQTRDFNKGKYSNGENTMTINGNTYKLYGEYTSGNADSYFQIINS